jgi:dihydrofolate synthase / folylpolyglutamate synthase
MTYQEALDYLGSLEPLGIRPGLDRIQALLADLGNPQDRSRSVLIAGTNGKGSVAAFLASILRESGQRAGLYTSPHLVRFEERIVVGEEPIAEAEVAALTEEVRAAIAAGRARGAEQPTYFEATTALAFLQFSRKEVPITVLEVGMGGRFDATNVVKPAACAITPIALDHTQWLGPTLRDIAYQKAGILKRGVTAVVSRQDPDALQVIRDEAGRVGAPLHLTSACEIQPEGGRRLYDPPAFSLGTPSGRLYPDLVLALRGAHQVENATVAVLMAELLEAGGLASIPPEAIDRGLRTAIWPGRIEIVPGSPDLLLDGAHNPAGCRSLADYLQEHQAGRRLTLVFAAMKDKPADRMLEILCPLMQAVVVTRVAVPRGESPEVLHRLATRHHRDVTRSPQIAEALQIARRAAGPGGLAVVSGSLYLVGEVKKLLP